MIRKKQAGQRQEASLLENTLLKLKKKEALRNLDQINQWGDTEDEGAHGLAHLQFQRLETLPIIDINIPTLSITPKDSPTI